MIARATLLWASVVGAVTFMGVHGRPIADDYCNAVRVERLGVFGAAESLFNTWHGGWSADLVISFYGRLIVGLPFGWSYFPFALTTLALLVLAARAVVVGLGTGRDRDPATWLLNVPLLTVLFLVGIASSSRGQDLLFGAFLWQAASIVHLWPILLGIILLFATLELRQYSRRGADVALVAGAVVVSGFNFTETAVFGGAATMLAVGTGVVAASALDSKAALRRTARRYALSGLVAVVSFAVMYLAPGTGIRRGFLEAPEAVDDGIISRFVRFQELVTAVVSTSLGRHGVILALVLGVGLGILSRRSGVYAIDVGRAAVVAVSAAMVAGVGVLITAAGQVASYPAPWHTLALIPIWIICALTLGVVVGAVLPVDGVRVPGLGSVAQGLPVVVALVLALHVAGYAGLLTARSSLWDSGAPAPIAGLPDREAGWVKGCWEELQPAAALATAGVSGRDRPAGLAR